MTSALRIDSRHLHSPVVAALTIGTIVFIASIFGILTRPVGFLAAFWPANAILLGLMVRFPAFAILPGWFAAFLGYIAADLLTGSELVITLWLTSANLAGAITGYLLFQFIAAKDRQLQRPLSVLYLFAICMASAAIAAIVGGGAARVLFNRDFLAGVEFWFVTELVNTLIILPVILSFSATAINPFVLAQESHGALLQKIAPAFGLVLSVAAGTVIGGPGAIAFAVPALLWCALTYSVFASAVLTMLTCSWLLIAIALGVLHIPQEDMFTTMSSLRLGVALIALGPLSAASINSARNELLEKLAYAANHDSLTGLLSRRAFMKRAEQVLGDPAKSNRAAYILLLDIDHFKRINDQFGHAIGDVVLIAFSRRVEQTLRPSDVFSRIGGEEFAILLSNTTPDQIEAIAERIRIAVETMTVESARGPIAITVSIGVADAHTHPGIDLETLLCNADSALYEAKDAGRNQVRAA